MVVIVVTNNVAITTIVEMAMKSDELGPSRRKVLETGLVLAAAATLPLAAQSSAFAQTTQGVAMTASTVTTKDGVEIFFKDWGSKDAQPIMFHHGWPLS